MPKQSPFEQQMIMGKLSPEERKQFMEKWENELGKGTGVITAFNNPEHYHKHEIDTITFLQKGFPPEVCMGFLKGNVIKYTQRADYKNGREDYEKVLDYAKRMLDWYDKTHS